MSSNLEGQFCFLMEAKLLRQQSLVFEVLL